MRLVIQRVKKASVLVDNKVAGSIAKGLVIFVGIGKYDDEQDAHYLAKKCSNLRIFDDERKKMNLSIKDTGGEVLIVSQFTLYADTRSGNRPDFSHAKDPTQAEILYNKFVELMRKEIGDEKVKTGIFRAMMTVEIWNDGPVTIIIDSKTTNDVNSKTNSK